MTTRNIKQLNLIGYIVVIIITAFIVSIITEHLVVRRLELSPGVVIRNGRCRLETGYGKLKLD